MASTFVWGEDNGAAAGTPPKGTTRTFSVTQSNWKNTDDVGTAYSTSPISAGSNSYPKYQFGVLGGTFNQISNGLIAHTGGAFTAGLSLIYQGLSGYVTPATTASTFTADLTAIGSITTGLAVLFGTVGPEAATAATLVATGYTHYMATQLQTTIAAGPGDTNTIYLCFRYDEN